MLVSTSWTKYGCKQATWCNNWLKLDSAASLVTTVHELLKQYWTICFAKCSIYLSPNSFEQTTFLINSICILWHPVVKNNRINKILHSHCMNWIIHVGYPCWYYELVESKKALQFTFMRLGLESLHAVQEAPTGKRFLALNLSSLHLNSKYIWN